MAGAEQGSPAESATADRQLPGRGEPVAGQVSGVGAFIAGLWRVVLRLINHRDSRKEVIDMEKVEKKSLKKIKIRKAGPVRLTAAACPTYPSKL
ncbi:hypothetical protein [Micromonospora sp. LOL_015]|uniref:hypothetical protein n=1 Tax=Micromonospora sp. LOL_015 TaxID=3345416 RepID=UPI003A836D60